jgi:hypothetical protein
MSLLVENFVSYEDIKNKLKTDNFSGLLLKFGSDNCPPCRALDRGPLEELNTMVNKKLLNKKLLVINCNLSKHNFTQLIAEFHISMATSIPAFYLFKYNPVKNNLVELKYECLGYNMAESKEWLEQMTKNIINYLS